MTRLRGRSRFGVAKARASILFARIFKEMDGRVRPGHDGGNYNALSFAPSAVRLPASRPGTLTWTS
jgi:penicillin-binding protein 1C